MKIFKAVFIFLLLLSGLNAHAESQAAKEVNDIVCMMSGLCLGEEEEIEEDVSPQEDCDTYVGNWHDCEWLNAQKRADEKRKQPLTREVPELSWIATFEETKSKYLAYKQFGARGLTGQFEFRVSSSTKTIPTELENNGDIDIDWYFDGKKAQEECADNLCLPIVAGENILKNLEIRLCESFISRKGRTVTVKINTAKCDASNVHKEPVEADILLVIKSNPDIHSMCEGVDDIKTEIEKKGEADQNGRWPFSLSFDCRPSSKIKLNEGMKRIKAFLFVGMTHIEDAERGSGWMLRQIEPGFSYFQYGDKKD